MKYRIAALLMVLLAAPVQAQHAPGWDPGTPQATRAELEELLERLEATSQSSTYSEQIRAQATEHAQQVKRRLEEGDVQVGEALLIDVTGTPHEKLTSQYQVTPARTIVVPTVGEVSVAGVLQSELQAHLTQEFNRKIVAFQLSVRIPVRLEMTGAVRNPGAFVVPREFSLLDALNNASTAGGVTESARIDDLRILRGGRVVMEGEEWRQARMTNRTLADLGVRNGDVVEVPTRSSAVIASGRRMLGALSGLGSLIFLMRQMGIF